VKEKPWLRAIDPVIEAKYLIQCQLLEDGVVTLTAGKGDDEIVTLCLNFTPLVIQSRPLNVYGLDYVISGFLAACQMGDSARVVRKMLNGQPLQIQIKEGTLLSSAG
jgi:hypothetical protein